MCQSKGLYAIELLNISNKTQDALDLIQHFLIRFALGLSKFIRVSYILKILKIYDIKKIIFYKTINQVLLLQNNELTKNRFNTLNNCIYNKKSNSFIPKVKEIKLSISKDFTPNNFKAI